MMGDTFPKGDRNEIGRCCIFSDFQRNLLHYYRAKFNQTWHEAPLGKRRRDLSLYKFLQYLYTLFATYMDKKGCWLASQLLSIWVFTSVIHVLFTFKKIISIPLRINWIWLNNVYQLIESQRLHWDRKCYCPEVSSDDDSQHILVHDMWENSWFSCLDVWENTK